MDAPRSPNLAQSPEGTFHAARHTFSEALKSFASRNVRSSDINACCTPINSEWLLSSSIDKKRAKGLNKPDQQSGTGGNSLPLHTGFKNTAQCHIVNILQLKHVMRVFRPHYTDSRVHGFERKTKKKIIYGKACIPAETIGSTQTA